MFIVADLVSLSDHSKIDKTKILMTNGSLMEVESIAECSPASMHFSVVVLCLFLTVTWIGLYIVCECGISWSYSN